MSKSRLTPELDLKGIAPDEAFSVLGNETRLDIVRVLWQTGAANLYDDVCSDAETLSFSELRHRVGVEDNGRFNYHLSQLKPHFVRQTEDGYRLSGAGKRIARTVVAVSGADQVEFTADLEKACPLCDAPMTASYDDQWLRIECTSCAGMFGDETPDGTVYFANYPSAGLAQRSVNEAASTGLFRCLLDQAYLMQGVCRECAGTVAASVSVCTDHERGDGGRCSACGTGSPAWVDQRCETCGFAKRLPIEICSMGLTPVIGFLDDQGVDALSPTFEEVVDLLDTHTETTVRTDPLRVTVTFLGDGESLDVTLDEEMTVHGIDRRQRT